MKLTSLLAFASLVAPSLSQAVLYETTFETDAGWTLWASEAVMTVDDVLPPNGATPPSPPNALRFTEDGFPGGSWSWGRGRAQSPSVRLTGASDPQLTFWLYWDHEVGCAWDELSLEISDAGTGQLLYDECLTSTSNASEHRWSQFQRALDPAWGEVRISFTYDAWDWANFGDWGFLVDDFRVLDASCGSSVLCIPQPRWNGTPGPTLSTEGDATPATNNLRLVGTGFRPHTFASGFIGPETAVVPAGNGVRCIAGGSSVRLPVAPTRGSGTPWWTLDLTDPAIAPMVGVGLPLCVQAFYRDGSSINFSGAVRVDVCE